MDQDHLCDVYQISSWKSLWYQLIKLSDISLHLCGTYMDFWLASWVLWVVQGLQKKIKVNSSGGLIKLWSGLTFCNTYTLSVCGSHISMFKAARLESRLNTCLVGWVTLWKRLRGAKLFAWEESLITLQIKSPGGDPIADWLGRIPDGFVRLEQKVTDRTPGRPDHLLSVSPLLLSLSLLHCFYQHFKAKFPTKYTYTNVKSCYS